MPLRQRGFPGKVVGYGSVPERSNGTVLKTVVVTSNRNHRFPPQIRKPPMGFSYWRQRRSCSSRIVSTSRMWAVPNSVLNWLGRQFLNTHAQFSPLLHRKPPAQCWGFSLKLGTYAKQALCPSRPHSRAEQGQRNLGHLLQSGWSSSGATVAVSGIAIADLSNTIRANGIVLSGSTKLTEKDIAGPINMLLVGSIREGQGEGYGNDTSVLADVIILLHVSADRKNATALSFPRDLLVPWPACPSTSIPGPATCRNRLGKLTRPSQTAARAVLCSRLEALTGLKIPYLAMIDFKGVIEMSNAIGGVEVCLTKPIKDSYTSWI